MRLRRMDAHVLTFSCARNSARRLATFTPDSMRFPPALCRFANMPAISGGPQNGSRRNGMSGGRSLADEARGNGNASAAAGGPDERGATPSGDLLPRPGAWRNEKKPQDAVALPGPDGPSARQNSTVAIIAPIGAASDPNMKTLSRTFPANPRAR